MRRSKIFLESSCLDKESHIGPYDRFATVTVKSVALRFAMFQHLYSTRE
jgi:hypothetical protein